MNNSLISFFKLTSQRLKKNDFFQYGLPLFIFVIAGSYFLDHFMNMKLQYVKMNKNQIDFDALEKKGIHVKTKTVNLEEELNKIEKENASHDWKNIRAPRFWEDNEEFLKLKEEQNRILSERIQNEKLLQTQQ